MRASVLRIALMNGSSGPSIGAGIKNSFGNQEKLARQASPKNKFQKIFAKSFGQNFLLLSLMEAKVL
jgi:hypothetical protein